MTNETFHEAQRLSMLEERLERLIDCLRQWRGKKEIIIMADVNVDIKIVVSPAVEPLAVDASGVPATATAGQAYSGVIKASGGVPPYTFTDVSAIQVPVLDGFPAGVTLNADGTVTGTPTAAGNFEAVVDVADSAGASIRAKVKK